MLIANIIGPQVELQWEVEGSGGRLRVVLGDGLHHVEMSFP